MRQLIEVFTIGTSDNIPIHTFRLYQCLHRLFGTTETEGVASQPVVRLLETVEADRSRTNDLNRKGAQILSLDAGKGVQVADAKVLLAKMFGYSTKLRSSTQGRATFSMQFSEFAEVPARRAEAIIQKIRGVV